MTADVCQCGHGPTVHVGYTGGCGLCDACVGYRATTPAPLSSPRRTRPPRPPACEKCDVLWTPGHICGPSPRRTRDEGSRVESFAPLLTPEDRAELVRQLANGPLRYVSREYHDSSEIRFDKANEIMGRLEPLIESILADRTAALLDRAERAEREYAEAAFAVTQLAALRAAVTGLADEWDEQRSHYPTATDARAVGAEAAVKLCAQELRALLTDEGDNG